MKRNFYILIALLFCAAAAGAHPLGNFSVNQYSRLESDYCFSLAESWLAARGSRKIEFLKPCP